MMVNVRPRDQRIEVGDDGRAPEDGNQDCVPVSLAALAEALSGKRFTGDGLHDWVYGDGYVGLQDPARYVAYLAKQGLDMRSIAGPPAQLVARAVAEILAGHGVVLAIPSDWGAEPPTSSFAHMVAGCDVRDNGATLVAMNPWGGFYQVQPLAWWVERLAHCSYQGIWIVKKASDGSMGVDTSGLGSGFAAFATAHGLSCVSRDAAGVGEHEYARSAAGVAETFASFAPTAEYPQGVTLYYNSGNGELTAGKSSWVAAALWNRGEAIRTRAEADAKQAAQQVATLTQQVATLTQQVADAKKSQGDPRAMGALAVLESLAAELSQLSQAAMSAAA